MGHFIDGRSREVQYKGCDVTMLNYVSYLIANICIIIFGSFLIVINAVSSYSMWNIQWNLALRAPHNYGHPFSVLNCIPLCKE